MKNQQEKTDSHISSISKQMTDFLNWTSLGLMPVEWLRPENKAKQDEFLSRLYALFDQSYLKRNERLSEIYEKLNFLFWRRCVPSLIICLLSEIGLFLNLFHITPDYYIGGLLPLYFISLYFAWLYYNKYHCLLCQTKKILQHWCLDGWEDDIRDKMRVIVEDMENVEVKELIGKEKISNESP